MWLFQEINKNLDKICEDQILKVFFEFHITAVESFQFSSIPNVCFENESFSQELRILAFWSVFEKVTLFQGLGCVVKSKTISELYKTCCDNEKRDNMNTLFAMTFKLESNIYNTQKRSVSGEWKADLTKHSGSLWNILKTVSKELLKTKGSLIYTS